MLRTVDDVLELVESMDAQRYGEELTMLEHSLQAAHLARSSGASDGLVVAALLHDVGNLSDDAGEWGFPDHGESGAAMLRHLFPSEVTEPIRLHIAAKRYLVAKDPAYLAQLSRASVGSLGEQGGPFSPDDVLRFEAEPYAKDALALREFDDGGKALDADVPRAESYRGDVELFMRRTSATWARDACVCAECRDEVNGQHLVDSASFGELRVVREEWRGEHRVVDVADDDGDVHSCLIPVECGPSPLAPVEVWEDAWSGMTVHPLEAGLAEFVDDLCVRGIAVVGGLSTSPGTVLEFAEEVGFVRNTNYGDLFDVRAVPDPINQAFTTRGLPLHTDNPYRDPVPTVQLLHCLRAAESGGASKFSDGFKAARQLRDEHPRHFEQLTTRPMHFRFASEGVDLRARVPLIQLDASGEVVRVTVNNRSMETPQPDPAIDAWYSAYQEFARLLSAPNNSIELTLAAGELVAFDNRRVLHGRSGYDTDPLRHLQGCYIDIDSVRSDFWSRTHD